MKEKKVNIVDYLFSVIGLFTLFTGIHLSQPHAFGV